MIKKNQNPPNYTLLGLVLALVFLGVTVIASASSVLSWQNHTNTYYYLVHQILFGVLPGLLILALFSKINYHFWQKLAPILMLAAFLLLILVLVPGLGVVSGGARRWLDLGVVSVQPSEFAKLAMVVYLAAWFARKQKNLHDFVSGFLPSLLMVGLMAFLIFRQPDMGTLIVLAATAATMFFAAGSHIRHLLGTAGLAFAALYLAIVTTPYRVARVITFLDPARDPQGIGYHVNQALLAIGSGGLFGVGFNRSLQKYNYLPEPMGDSIFAVVGEEMGFLRSALIILMFMALAWLGLKIAQRTSDQFGRLLAVGLTAWIGLQAFINISAMLGIMPLTGIPLPFISYGSSSLLATLAGMGILLNISRQTG